MPSDCFRHLFPSPLGTHSAMKIILHKLIDLAGVRREFPVIATPNTVGDYRVHTIRTDRNICIRSFPREKEIDNLQSYTPLVTAMSRDLCYAYIIESNNDGKTRYTCVRRVYNQVWSRTHNVCEKIKTGGNFAQAM
jgi:hypothetical protein